MTNSFGNSVTVIDTATNTVATIIPVGAFPVDIDITPNGAFAYVANIGSNTVSVIDTTTNTVIATVAAGPGSGGVAVTPNGDFAYVVNTFNNNLSVIDTATNTVTATIPVGQIPLFIAFPRPQAPQDPIASLIAQIEALISEGALTQDQGAGLIDKLNEVRTKLETNETGAACNQLSAFINQVNALIGNGSLTQAQGQILIDAANAIRTSVGC